MHLYTASHSVPGMVRSLEKKDIETCIAISRIIFQKEGYEYDAEKYLNSFFREDQFIRPHFFVFEEAKLVKGLIGFSETGFDSGFYGIFMCYVHPDFHNKGIGKNLTARALEEIKERGGRAVMATTRYSWHFERFGFKEIFSPYPDWHVMQVIL